MGKCKCNTCDEGRPDALRTNIVTTLCGDPCNDCVDACDVIDNSDCPYGQMSDKCIVYTGCKTFISQIRPGMNIQQVINAFENTFEQVDRLIERLNEEIIDLKEKLDYLENLHENGNRCNSFE